MNQRKYGDFTMFIKRFTERIDYSSGEDAINELKHCKKETHWMWYIFPQLKHLGKSEMAIYYGIYDIEEAKLYIKHPVTGKFLINITKLVNKCLEYKTVGEIFGSIDKHKFKSCMELFYEATINTKKNKIFKECLLKL
jgi:uncharacterized protein (DUF1810 family)